jgi:hypothetical protein
VLYFCASVIIRLCAVKLIHNDDDDDDNNNKFSYYDYAVATAIRPITETAQGHKENMQMTNNKQKHIEKRQ